MCLRKRRSAFYTPLEESIQVAEESVVSEEFQSPLEGPEAAYSRKELGESLKRAVGKLRPAYRVVFLLRSVEQLSTSETAKVLQISASAVKARTASCARSELRAWLEEARSVQLREMQASDAAGRSSENAAKQNWLI